MPGKTGKRKIPEPTVPQDIHSLRRVADAQHISALAHPISFSFKFLEERHAKFDYSKQPTKYFADLLARLKGCSTLSALELIQKGDPSMRCHLIAWNKTTEKNFPKLPEPFSSCEPRQFSISKKYGRVHGFLSGPIF